jgi:hypothetical protein
VTDLERIGHLLGGWLQEHRRNFPPLEVRGIVPSVEVDGEGPVVRLTLALHPGGDGAEGWPMPAVAALCQAIREVAREKRDVPVEFLLQDVRNH